MQRCGWWNNDCTPSGVISHLHTMFRDIYRGRHVYEVFCGSGDSFEPMLFEPDLYTGVDPNIEAIERFKVRYPAFKDNVFVSTFDGNIGIHCADNPIVLAILGAASYIKEDCLRALDKSGADYILMFYQEEKHPQTYCGISSLMYTVEDIRDMLSSAQILPCFGCYIASNMNFHNHEISRIVEWELSHFKRLFQPNPFHPKGHYNDLFNFQMMAIMENSDTLFSEYEPYIDFKSLNLDYYRIVAEYEDCARRCQEIIGEVSRVDKESFEIMINCSLSRIELFKQYISR